MKIRTAAAAAALAALALTGCAAATDDSPKSDKAVASPPVKPTPNPGMSEAMKAAGIPPEPAGADRTELLTALNAANPALRDYEGKTIDAARNQCAAINNKATRLDSIAALRFTFKDVTTTEAQGAKINQALRDTGFCKV